MSEELGNGDSVEVKNTLMKLQNEKKLLNEKLAQIEIKSQVLSEKLEKQKIQTSNSIEMHKRLVEQISQLREESVAMEESARRVESNLSQSRDCVQQLNKQLIEKRINQSIVLDRIQSETNDLCKQFTRLTQINNSGQSSQRICSQISEIDQQIRDKRQKRSSLKEKLNQLREETGSQSERASGEGSQGLVDNDFNSKWEDWPIKHRMMTLELFLSENESLAEHLDSLSTLEPN